MKQSIVEVGGIGRVPVARRVGIVIPRGVRRDMAPRFPWRQTLFWLLGPLFVIAVTSQWFPPGRLIAGGDNFPTDNINPANWMGRVRYAWDLTGIGGPGSPALLLPPIVVNRILRLVLSPANTQHVYFAIIFAGQFLSMLFFSLTLFPRRRIAAYGAALFYCFNPFVMLGLPTWFPLFILSYLPFMAALFVRLVKRPLNAPRLLVFALAASVSGIMFVNPPTYALFLAFACAIMAYVLVGHRRDARVWRRTAILIALFALANVYWVAQVYFGLFGAGHQQVSAVTNSADLSGVSARSSILNVFWLNPIWAWGGFSFSRAYNVPLLLITVFVPAILAFSALLNRAIPRRIVLPATAIALLMLFLTTGQHDPWQNINLFIYHHVPLFWLFRDPDGKFPNIVLVLYAPLIGYQAAWLAEQAAAFLRRGRFLAFGARAGVLSMIGLAFLISAFPLVTGAVVGRGYISPQKVGVALPPYWFDLANYLSRHDPHSRVLLLPNDDFYQMPYTWGYYGADNVASEYLPNGSIVLTGGGGAYTTASSGYDAFVGTMLRLVQSGSHQSLAPYLAALNVRYIVQRNDIVAASPTRHILLPQQIRAYLRTQPSVHFMRSFGQLDLYRVDRRDYVPPVYTIALPSATPSVSQGQRLADRAATAALGFSGKALPTVSPSRYRALSPRPRIVRLDYSWANATRLLARVGPTQGPVLLMFSTLYHPGWHACIVPVNTPTSAATCGSTGGIASRDHLQPLGFLNGWVIDHPGRYAVVVDYSPQHLVDVAFLLSAFTIAGLIVAALWFVTPPPLVRVVQVAARRVRPRKRSERSYS